MAILESKNVTKFFGNLAAVNHLSFNVEDGEIFGIAGPNGAGKTTLFNLIAGTFPYDGEIIFMGEQINNLRPHRICEKGIARTFQVPLVFPTISVYDNIETAAHFGNDKKKDRKEIIPEMIQFVGLEGKENVKAENLRLYDKKMTMLATVLATRPKLLLLDEPASGLNPKEVEQSVQLFNMINKKLGVSIIVIEHLMRVLMTISNRLMILHNGEQISIGKPEQVSKDKNVIEIYLGSEYVKS